MAIGVYYELCIHWFFHDFEIGIFSVLFFTFFCTLAPFGSFPLWCLIYPWFLFWDFLYFFHLFCILAPFGSFLLWCRSLQPDSSLIALFRSRVWSPSLIEIEIVRFWSIFSAYLFYFLTMIIPSLIEIEIVRLWKRSFFPGYLSKGDVFWKC